MNPELKAKWVAALRSGEIEQGTGKLLNDRGAMCCVGVLARICGISDEDMLRHPKALYSNGMEAVGQAVGDQSERILYDLAYKNDGGESFAQIASYIEAKL